MGQSFKAVVQLIWLVCVIVTFLAWGAPQHPQQFEWSLRIGDPILVAALSVFILKVEARKDLLPDLLRQQFGASFERDGLTFAAVFETIDGQCWFSVYFQNRYLGACRSEILIRPGVKTLGVTRHDAPEMRVTIECPGGGFGVARRLCEIPESAQGRKIRYDFWATTAYPGGAGKLVRFREGMRVGPVPSWIDTLATGVVVASLGIPGKAAGCELLVPKLATRVPTERAEGIIQILWTPP